MADIPQKRFDRLDLRAVGEDPSPGEPGIAPDVAARILAERQERAAEAQQAEATQAMEKLKDRLEHVHPAATQRPAVEENGYAEATRGYKAVLDMLAQLDEDTEK